MENEVSLWDRMCLDISLQLYSQHKSLDSGWYPLIRNTVIALHCESEPHTSRQYLALGG